LWGGWVPGRSIRKGRYRVLEPTTKKNSRGKKGAGAERITRGRRGGSREKGKRKGRNNSTPFGFGIPAETGDHYVGAEKGAGGKSLQPKKR